jgi:hypothetical protein
VNRPANVPAGALDQAEWIGEGPGHKAAPPSNYRLDPISNLSSIGQSKLCCPRRHGDSSLAATGHFVKRRTSPVRPEGLLPGFGMLAGSQTGTSTMRGNGLGPGHCSAQHVLRLLTLDAPPEESACYFPRC